MPRASRACRGYATGGTIHFIINNQVGFTTSPQFARSSPYPSDVAKGVQAPILHVNGDDPEAVTFCCKLAIEFRQKFNRDIVIDMWCYRRFGHNEGDEPSFTQPLMYAAIKQHPPISEIYGKRLIDEGVIDQAWIDQHTRDYLAPSRKRVRGRRCPTCPTRPTGSTAAGPGSAARASRCSAAATSRPRSTKTSSTSSAQVLTTVPEGFAIHKTLQRIIDAKRQMFESGDGLRLGDRPRRSRSAACSPKATASACRARTAAAARSASATRSGSTRRRATNISRCARSSAAGSRCATARCREFGVLGFEYGYSLADPQTLVLWEAQFGDFANGAQIIIDQFIAVGRGQVAARQRPRHAAAARLRGPGAGAQLGAARALPAALRRGQYAGRQLHDAGQLFPHPAPADAARFPQAADDHDAQVAAAAQAGGLERRPTSPARAISAASSPTSIRRPRARRGGWCCARARSPTS